MDENKTKKKSRRLTEDEQIARLNKQIAELDAQQKALAARKRAVKARVSSKGRSARAHRLIQVGAIVESVYGSPVSGDLMLKALEQFLRDQDTRGGYFSKALHEAENIQRSQAAADSLLPVAENETENEAVNNENEEV